MYLTQGQIPTACELRYWASRPLCGRSPVVATLEGLASDDAGEEPMLLRLYICQHHYDMACRSRDNPKLMELTRLEDYEIMDRQQIRRTRSGV